MTNIPTKIAERRAELLRQAEEHRKAMLVIMRDQRVTDAALAELDFAIAAYADCTPKYEALSAAPRSGAPPWEVSREFLS